MHLQGRYSPQTTQIKHAALEHDERLIPQWTCGLLNPIKTYFRLLHITTKITMNPFKFSAATCVLIGSVITLVSSVVVPGASTPLFYLVSSTSSNSAANLLVRVFCLLSFLIFIETLYLQPLRSGGAGGYTTLSGSGAIGQFYFFQGKFVMLDSTQSSSARGNIGEIPASSGCTTYGPLGFFGSSTDKCANFGTFSIQSNGENSQIGAFLVFNGVGGFYACGNGNDVVNDVRGHFYQSCCHKY